MIKKRILIVLLLSALLLIVSACSTFLETERVRETPNPPPPYTPPEKPPDERMEITDYNDFFDAILTLISEHVNTGLFISYSMENESFQEDIERVANEIEYYHPIGAFATSNISVAVRRNPAYIEIDVNIEYKRTKEQVESIINVATVRYLRTELLRVLEGHREEVAFRIAGK